MADPLIIWFGDSFAQFACEAQPKRVVIRKRAARPFYDGRHMSVAEAESLATNVSNALKQKGPAEAATSPSHGPTTPTQEKAMDVRSDNIPAAPSARSVPYTVVTGALDELAGARLDALTTILLLEIMLEKNPNDPGFTYGLNREQKDVVFHSAMTTLDAIKRVAAKLEASQ